MKIHSLKKLMQEKIRVEKKQFQKILVAKSKIAIPKITAR
jgi:hypothetical protein